MTHSAAPQLDYATRPSARRRWGRRLLRWWPLGLILVVGLVSLKFGPRLWAHWKLLRAEQACMSAELPGDRVVCDEDPASARALVAALPAEYQLDSSRWAVRVDSRWTTWIRDGRISISNSAGFPLSTTFLHERHTPSGERRLVVLEGWESVVVLKPMGWLGEPSPVITEKPTLDDRSFQTIYLANNLPGPTRIYAGVADPLNWSRFTVPFVFHGVAGTWELELTEDDRVTRRLLDPDGFAARAQAAHVALRRPHSPR